MLAAAMVAAGAAALAQEPVSVTLPAGTTINVRLTQDVDVDAAQAGGLVKAIVDDPVIVKSTIVIPRDARASVQIVKTAQSGKFKGSDQISLKLNSVSFGGKTHELATEYATVESKGEGKKTTRKVAGGAGLGAIVGGIAGGGKGALIGTAVGAGAGTAVAAGGEQHLKLPAETRLAFKTSASLRIEP
jgi:hypothetical protein